jgi:hypothetical protein
MRYRLMDGYLGPDEILSGILGVLDSAGMELAGLPPGMNLFIGTTQALAGDYGNAVNTLEAQVDAGVSTQDISPALINARHGLAWAWLQTGATEPAMALLELLDQHYRDQRDAGRLHMSGFLFGYAQNTLLLGDTDRALELLEQAVGSGWHGYYAIRHDPRWDAVRDAPQFQAIMARVKADLDMQRAQVEAIDAEDDFEARLDAAIAAQQARP